MVNLIFNEKKKNISESKIGEWCLKKNIYRSWKGIYID